MELKQEAQTFEMPHLLTYYECDETSRPSLSMILRYPMSIVCL